jgi:hypothetical protein
MASSWLSQDALQPEVVKFVSKLFHQASRGFRYDLSQVSRIV